MESFKNVTVVPQANVYFDGQVTSRKLVLSDGSVKTLGIMMPGDYTFGTSQNELMEIIAGKLQVLLPGEEQWQEIEGGMSFKVPADSEFQVKVETLTDYCCSYS